MMYTNLIDYWHENSNDNYYCNKSLKARPLFLTSLAHVSLCFEDKHISHLNLLGKRMNKRSIQDMLMWMYCFGFQIPLLLLHYRRFARWETENEAKLKLLYRIWEWHYVLICLKKYINKQMYTFITQWHNVGNVCLHCNLLQCLFFFCMEKQCLQRS